MSEQYKEWRFSCKRCKCSCSVIGTTVDGMRALCGRCHDMWISAKSKYPMVADAYDVTVTTVWWPIDKKKDYLESHRNEEGYLLCELCNKDIDENQSFRLDCGDPYHHECLETIRRWDDEEDALRLFFSF
jgi:hypothetical protein